MIRAVLDTNVYISGILFGGNPKKLIERAVEGKLQIYITSEIITEIRDVLSRDKFGFSPEYIQSIIGEIEAISVFVIPKKKHTVVNRDIDDNIIIDCAVEGRVDYIITGDSDLLSLKQYKNIIIINPAEFLLNSGEN